MMADVEDYDEEEDEDMVLDDGSLEALVEDSENWPCWSKRCKRNKCHKSCHHLPSGTYHPERRNCHARCDRKYL